MKNENLPDKKDDFTLQDFLASEMFSTALHAFVNYLEKRSESEQQKNEIEKRRIEAEVEIHKLEVQKQQIETDYKIQTQQQIMKIDSRDKIFFIGLVIIVLASSVVLRIYDVLDKSQTSTIVILVLGAAIGINKDYIVSIFKSKKADKKSDAVG